MSTEPLTDRNRLDALQDEAIDLSDVPEIAPDMVAKAVAHCDGQPLSPSLPFQSVLDRSRSSIHDGKRLSHDDFWRAVADCTPEAAETDQSSASGATQGE